MTVSNIIEQRSIAYGWTKIMTDSMHINNTYVDVNDIAISVNTKSEEFELSYIIPHSTMKITSGPCGSFCNEKHFMRLYTQITNQANVLKSSAYAQTYWK